MNTQGLPVGDYKGVINVASAGAGNNGTVAVPVNLTVTAGATFTLTPTSLSFAYQRNQSIPANRTVNCRRNERYARIHGRGVTSSGELVQVSPPAATAPTNFVVGVNPGALTPAIYTGKCGYSTGSAVVQNHSGDPGG